MRKRILLSAVIVVGAMGMLSSSASAGGLFGINLGSLLGGSGGTTSAPTTVYGATPLCADAIVSLLPSTNNEILCVFSGGNHAKAASTANSGQCGTVPVAVADLGPIVGGLCVLPSNTTITLTNPNSVFTALIL